MGGSRIATSQESVIIMLSFAKYLASLNENTWSTRVMFVDYLDTIGCRYEGMNSYTIVNESRFAWEVLKHATKNHQ
jgi:hypothetical protein